MISIAVEGESDREAAKAIVRATGRSVAKVYPAGGKTRLDPKISNYCRAARFGRWVVFRDSDGECPVALRRRLLAGVEPTESRFALRVAHSMTEAWLLADTQGFAAHFGIRVGQIPPDVEALPHAKRTLLTLCLGSRFRWVREEVVTAEGETGPLYVHHLNEFARARWDVSAAAVNSPSLSRAVRAIQALE